MKKIKVLNRDHELYSSFTYNPGLKEAIKECRKECIDSLFTKDEIAFNMDDDNPDLCMFHDKSNPDCFTCFKNKKQWFRDFKEVNHLVDSKDNLLRKRRDGVNNV